MSPNKHRALIEPYNYKSLYKNEGYGSGVVDLKKIRKIEDKKLERKMKQFTFFNGTHRIAPTKQPGWDKRKKLSPEKMMQLKLLNSLLCSGKETAERLVLEADLENFRLDDLKKLAIDDENSDDLNNKDNEIDDDDDSCTGISGVLSNNKSMDEHSNGSSGDLKNKNSNSSDLIDEKFNLKNKKSVTRLLNFDQSKWLGPVGGYDNDIPKKQLQHLGYKMAAKLAIEDLEIKNNSKSELEKIMSGTTGFVKGFVTALNLKLKDEHGKSCVYEARIHSHMSTLLGLSRLDISGKLTYDDDVGGATTTEI